MEYLLLVKNEQQKNAAQKNGYGKIPIHILGDELEIPNDLTRARTMRLPHLGIIPDETWLEGLHELSGIKSIEIREEMAAYLLQEHLPSSIEHISISGEKTVDLFDNGVFENIRRVDFYYGKLKIRKSGFPNLRHLAINIDGTKKQSKALLEFTELECFEVGPLKNSELMSALNLTSLGYLNIWSGSIPNLHSLGDLPSLNRLKLKNLSKIECLNGIGNIPMLDRIDVSWCSQLKNIDAVLNCERLAKIDISNCLNLSNAYVSDVLEKSNLNADIGRLKIK